jgi:hypothetical protein
MRCTLMRCTPSEVHAHEMHAYEEQAHEVHAYERFYEDLARQHRRTPVLAPARFSASSHMSFYAVAYGFQSSS